MKDKMIVASLCFLYITSVYAIPHALTAKSATALAIASNTELNQNQPTTPKSPSAPASNAQKILPLVNATPIAPTKIAAITVTPLQATTSNPITQAVSSRAPTSQTPNRPPFKAVATQQNIAKALPSSPSGAIKIPFKAANQKNNKIVAPQKEKIDKALEAATSAAIPKAQPRERILSTPGVKRLPLFSNDKTAVWETVISPGAGKKIPMHRHDFDRIIVALTDGKLKITDDQGVSHLLTLKKEDAYFLAADTYNHLHTDENISDHEIRVIVIELRYKPDKSV